MNELLHYRYDALASLYWSPCSDKELNNRDFCKHLPLWYIQQILQTLERKGYVFMRKDGVWKAIKSKARKELNERGYEID